MPIKPLIVAFLLKELLELLQAEGDFPLEIPDIGMPPLSWIERR